MALYYILYTRVCLCSDMNSLV